MKFLHTSDWHVGRTLNGWSLLEEQEWAFQQIVDLAIHEQVDGVIIAGDLYDRAVPPVDAIKLFNRPWHVWSWRSRFLSMLSVVITMGLNACILAETFFNLRGFI